MRWCPGRERTLHLYTAMSKLHPHLEKGGESTRTHPLPSAATGFPGTNVLPGSLIQSAPVYIPHPPFSAEAREKCLLCHCVCAVFHVCQQKHLGNRMTWEGSLQTEQLKSDCLATYKLCFPFTAPSFQHPLPHANLQQGLSTQRLQVPASLRRGCSPARGSWRISSFATLNLLL